MLKYSLGHQATPLYTEGHPAFKWKVQEALLKVGQKRFSSKIENNFTQPEMEIEFVLQILIKLLNCCLQRMNQIIKTSQKQFLVGRKYQVV